MYKLVIVDDEFTVRNFLRYVVNQYQLPIEICGEGENGEEATELVEKYQPDFLIMDIQMPIMDGLQAAELIKRQSPSTLIFMLTAYEYFEYAHKAIQINVQDYLLKPIKPEDVAKALEKGIAEVQKREAALKKIGLLEKQVEKITPTLKKKLIHDLISGEKVEDKDIDLFKSIGTREIPAPAGVVVFCLWDQQGRLVNDQFISESIANEIDNLVGYGLFETFCNGLSVLFLENWNIEQKHRLERFIEDGENTWLLNIGMGVVDVHGWHPIADAYQRAASLSKTALFWQKSGVYTGAANKEMYTLPDVIQLQKSFSMAIMERKLPKVKELTVEMQGEMKKHFYPVNKVVSFSHQLVTFLLSDFATKIEFTEKDNSIFKEAIERMDQVNTFLELEVVLWEISLALANKLGSLGESLAEQSAKWALTYILHNYSQNLSLEGISKQLFISPTYFSKIFKKYTGEGFNSFLIRIRLEEAEKLLKTGNYTVAEVSHRIGFCDPSYFSYMFKKHRGIPPKDVIAKQES